MSVVSPGSVKESTARRTDIKTDGKEKVITYTSYITPTCWVSKFTSWASGQHDHGLYWFGSLLAVTVILL